MAFRGDIPADEAIAAVDRLAAATIIYEPPGGDARDEIDLARRLGWATSYDAEYVALASRLDCALVTLDDRLRRGVGRLISVLGPADL